MEYRGYLYAGKQEFESALDDLERATELYKEITENRNGSGVGRVGRVLIYSAFVLHKLSRIDDALDKYNTAVSMLSTTSDHGDTGGVLADALVGRASAFYTQGRFEDADRDVSSAVGILRREAGSPEKLADLLGMRARVLVDLGETERAFSDIDEAVDLLEKVAALQVSGLRAKIRALRGAEGGEMESREGTK